MEAISQVCYMLKYETIIMDVTMPPFAQIHLEFDDLTADYISDKEDKNKIAEEAHYPRNNRLPTFVTAYLVQADKWAYAAKEKEWMLSHGGSTPDDFKKAHEAGDKDAQFSKNTSCCMQVSHAFNCTPKKQPGNISHRIPEFSFKRPNVEFKSKGNGFYIQGVPELSSYLTAKYGQTDEAQKANLAGKKGILTFGGSHTEFWDGDRILQGVTGVDHDGLMSADFMNKAWGTRVLFWEINGLLGGLLVPQWLEGWWTVYESYGGKALYYYYFSNQGIVSYTTIEPKPPLMPGNIKNQGKVTTAIKGQSILGFAIDWKQDDKTHVAAKETLTVGMSQALMTSNWNMRSNNFRLLVLTKGVPQHPKPPRPKP